MMTAILQWIIVIIGTCAIDFTTATTESSYPITDTGQSKCYKASNNNHNWETDCTNGTPAGQDGFYSGLKMKFCDNKDGTITDYNTGLMWTQTSYGPLTIEQVNSNIASGSVVDIANYDDWRLPTIKELHSIAHFDGETGQTIETNIPYYDSAFFSVNYGTERFIDGQEWSSNKYTGKIFNGRQECHFGFNPIDGRIKCYPMDAAKFVRYVRTIHSDDDHSSSSLFSNEFQLSEANNEIVEDTATGFQWMKYDSGWYYRNDPSSDGSMDWPTALEYCEEMTLGGYEDWRLPNAHELQSIVDYNRSPDFSNSASIDPIFYATSIVNEVDQKEQSDYAWYWTSTTHLDGPPNSLRNAAIYIAFGRATGNITSSNNDNNNNPNQYHVIDVHGAGAQRSEVKVGPNPSPFGRGPQGDMIRIYNMVRCVRGASSPNKKIVPIIQPDGACSLSIVTVDPETNHESNNIDDTIDDVGSGSACFSTYFHPIISVGTILLIDFLG